MNTYARQNVAFVRGEGVWLWDEEGRKYLDALAGIAVNTLGYAHPKFTKALSARINSGVIHTSNLWRIPDQEAAADRVAEITGLDEVFFCNSGLEANEAAIKVARKHAHARGIAAPEIVSFEGEFHGRTYGALSATPQESKQAPFAPLVPGFVTVPADAGAVTAAVGEGTAALFLEPVQGETGIHVLPDELLEAARAACDRTGALLVYDEIQTGMGRTGKLWAFEHSGIAPDLLTSAKALGGGMPIGALVTKPEYGDVFSPGDHASTFAGGPVVCAAGLAALNVVDDPALLDRVCHLGARLAEGLATLPGVTEVRGVGLMLAFDTNADAPDLVRRALTDERLVLNATGPRTVRLEPPLIVGPDQVDDALARLGRLLSSDP
jgi:predicted acetylornithine/succinylornithine family transaminase